MAAAAAIDAMVRAIVEHVSPEKVILFGSHARGSAGPDSDVDLLVVLRDVTNPRSKAKELYLLLAESGIPKDIVVVTPEEVAAYRDVPGTLIKPALLEGKVLYERVA